MNITKDIFNIIKNINDSNEKDIEKLKSIIFKYPYFQSIYAILAKKLFIVDNRNKIQALEIAAIYAPDRHKLKQFLENKYISFKNSGSYFEDYNDSDDSKYSDMVISETLAKIMVKQEKLLLAMKIYNRLILKFPQKKPYFVKIINKLKAKLS